MHSYVYLEGLKDLQLEVRLRLKVDFFLFFVQEAPNLFLAHKRHMNIPNPGNCIRLTNK